VGGGGGGGGGAGRVVVMGTPVAGRHAAEASLGAGGKLLADRWIEALRAAAAAGRSAAAGARRGR
jgi:hypothetical protein